MSSYIFVCLFFSLSLNEVHDILEELDHEATTVSINPPHEDGAADTDCDSDASDDEVTCNPDHLPRRILTSEVVFVAASDQEDDTNDESATPSTSSQPPGKRRKRNYNWHNNSIRAKPTVPGYVEKQNDDLMKLKEEIKNPEDCIRLFWTDKWIDELCEQSKLYAAQNSFSSDNVTEENMISFMTTLVISGYNKLPTRRLYWSESPDVFNQLISDSIRRDTFEEIMRCLHFADNMKITEDKFYKVIRSMTVIHHYMFIYCHSPLHVYMYT